MPAPLGRKGPDRSRNCDPNSGCGGVPGSPLHLPRCWIAAELYWPPNRFARAAHAEVRFDGAIQPGTALLRTLAIERYSFPAKCGTGRKLRHLSDKVGLSVIAVAVTGPTPGILTSLRQALFSRAIFSIELSARSIVSASCSSSCFSSASNISSVPDNLHEPSASMPGNASST